MAMFTPSVPPSAILKSKEKGGNEGIRQTKEEYRKMKELEEARKAGTAPAMVDEEGRDINPHIPQFIAQAPWYLGATGPTLIHQRPHPDRQKKFSEIGDWYRRGVSDKVATKFRKGACENCGAITHTKKDCFERPRKVGARFTGEDIAPDEPQQPSLKQNWEAKRDRWNGYDPASHSALVDEFQRLEEMRKMIKAQHMKDGTEGETEAEQLETPEQVQKALHLSEDFKEDEDKYAEDADMPGVKLDTDSRTRITVRNLRIREDTAKYLHNLDPDSAYYDPKSRSMRENPYETLGKTPDSVAFGGENFVRFSGEVQDVNEAQLFAWEAQKKGVDVHTLAEPTKLEALKQDISGRQDSWKSDKKRDILDRYGGEQYLRQDPIEVGQTEAYVEYSRKGRVVKGVERQKVKSRYEEDVLTNNHQEIWGSFWRNNAWGYKCCHSMVKNSYCTGEAGKIANLQAGETGGKSEGGENLANKLEKKSKKRRKSESDSSSSSDSESSSSDSDSSDSESENSDEKRERIQKEKAKSESRREKKREKRAKKRKMTKRHKKSDKEGKSDLEKALEKAATADKNAEEILKLKEQDRPYNSRYDDKAPTDMDMEAYKLRQLHSSDPMAEFVKEKRA